MILHHKDRLRELGGPGSGNFGHAGIPGQRGGSAPKGSGGGESKGKAEPKQKESKLTQSEKYAIQDYSGDQFQELNSKLRSGDPLTKSQENLAKDLDSAIDKVDKVDGIVYRTVSFDTPEEASNYANSMIDNQDSIIKSDAFLSATENKAVWGYDLAAYDKKSVRITIVSKTGGRVSKYSNNPNEKEVIFKRGTKFKFGGSKENKSGQPELLWREE